MCTSIKTIKQRIFELENELKYQKNKLHDYEKLELDDKIKAGSIFSDGNSGIILIEDEFRKIFFLGGFNGNYLKLWDTKSFNVLELREYIKKNELKYIGSLNCNLLYQLVIEG